MKANRIAFTTITILVTVTVAASVLWIQFASALDDATSTDPTTFEPSAEEPSVPASTTPSTETPSDPTGTSSTAPSAAPTTLTLVHTAGTKYIDYCTDGITITAYPGDPAIAANFDKPNAPTPQCPDGQTWHHTSGMTAYDTPSGDLEVGQYALVGGAYTAHYHATTYTDATSTVEWLARMVSGLTTDPVTGALAPIVEPPTIEAAPAAGTESGSPTSPAAASSTSTNDDASTDTTHREPDASTSTDSTSRAADTIDAAASTTAP